MHSSDRNGQDERYGILVLRFGDGRNISNININNVKISNIYPTPGDATKEHQGYGIRFESYNNSDRIITQILKLIMLIYLLLVIMASHCKQNVPS